MNRQDSAIGIISMAWVVMCIARADMGLEGLSTCPRRLHPSAA